MARRWIVRSGDDLGRSIAGLREMRGVTQAQLAEVTRIDRTYLARVEAGHVTQMIERLIELVRALGAELVVMDRNDGG